MSSQPSRTILLVEDSEDDAFAMRRALKAGNISNPLHLVTDGQQALDYLSGAAPYADRAQHPLPFIIFLDLKLPYVSGFEVLAWIRRQHALKTTVVVALTGSAEARDQDRAYALGARSYLVKPPTGPTLNAILDSLGSYWLATSETSPVVRVKNGPGSAAP